MEFAVVWHSWLCPRRRADPRVSCLMLKEVIQCHFSNLLPVTVLFCCAELAVISPALLMRPTCGNEPPQTGWF